jgi:hypothetical protein
MYAQVTGKKLFQRGQIERSKGLEDEIFLMRYSYSNSEPPALQAGPPDRSICAHYGLSHALI